MSENEEYKNGKATVFLFPDSREFEKHIGAAIAIPIETKITLTTGTDQKRYFFDETVHGGTP